MRVEVYGCRWTDGIISYSMPQGDKRGNDWEFYDIGYDGHWDGEELRRGLGQLTDGKFGPDNFKMGYYENVQGWVGWRNDTRNNKPIEIKFEFDKVREFTALHIFCNNQFTKDVQVNMFHICLLIIFIKSSVSFQGFLRSQSHVQCRRAKIQRRTYNI